MFWECPLKKKAKMSYTAAQAPQQVVPATQSFAPASAQHVTFAPTASSYSYAPAQQYSHVQHSHSSDLSRYSREDLEKMVLQLTNSKRYSNMMVFNYLANHANSYTLLLDSGGSDHDMSNPAFKFNVRPNPDADVPIKTIMGIYHCKEICTTPFLGSAGSNDAGNLNIISLGKLQDTPNVEIESDKKISQVKVTFTLLNLTITFKFGESRILVADGKPLADAIHEYTDLCDKKGMNMLDALNSSVTIDQLMDPDFESDISTKISMIMQNSKIEPITTPMNASFAGFKLDKSEFITKRSILVAQRVGFL
jgi:hypothetical protein